MDAKRLKQLEKGNTGLKKLLAGKGAGPVDSPGGGGGKLLSPARARHRPLHWRQLPARWRPVPKLGPFERDLQRLLDGNPQDPYMLWSAWCAEPQDVGVGLSGRFWTGR